MHDVPFVALSAELADDPTVDITTIGRRSGEPRRLEIWITDVDGRFFITGTTGRRDWLANLRANGSVTVHLQRDTCADVAMTAVEVTDAATRSMVFEHPAAAWYRDQEPLDVLVAEAPMVELVLAEPA